MHRSNLVAAAVVLGGLLAQVASAGVIYSEAVSGDAGVDPSSAALGSLAAGNHQIVGGNLQFDTDDYAFSIGTGLQLDAIVVDSYTAIGSVGMQSPVLGPVVLNSGSVGKSYLTLAGIANPLNAGNYVFRTTTGTGGPTTYQFSLQVSAVPSPATIRYNESVSGDAGVNTAAASVGAFTAGSNRIIGGSTPFDTDDFSFTVPAGMQLDRILIESYSGIGSAGMQNPALGSATLSPASVGQNFLALANITQPIGPGTYLFRSTTGTGGPTSYRFDFQLSSVPEPTTLSLLAMGSLVAVRRRGSR